jgi:hypothetical protein
VVAECLPGVTRLGASNPERKRSTVKKMIIAAVGGALLSGLLLGAGTANADPVLQKLRRSARRRGDTDPQGRPRLPPGS